MKIGVQESDLSPWYNVDQALLQKLGAQGLLDRYKGSYYTMLKEVYPEHDWLPWKFKKVPRFIGGDMDILRKAVSFVEAERQLSKPQDWYSVTQDQLKELGVFGVFTENGGLFQCLKLIRPDFNWEEDKFVSVRNFAKQALRQHLRRLWPKLKIVQDYQLTPEFTVTFFIPTLNLAFDYQPLSKYDSNEETLFDLTSTESARKAEAAERLGVSLVSVPFWWDRSLDSLTASILEQKPSLQESLSTL